MRQSAPAGVWTCRVSRSVSRVGVPLQVGGFSIGLPGAEVVALGGDGGGLVEVDLADALAGAVVDVVGDAAALMVGFYKTVLGVPGEAAGYRGHRGHVAVGVVGVGLAVVFGVFEVVAGEGGGEQAVAGGGVSVAAMPDGDTTGAVFHAENVAGGVVGVGLGVISLGLGVLGVGDGGEAFGGGLREGVVFATCRLGQAVERVVGEGLGGVGVGVVEKDAGLGEVADPGDVADGVVVVAEILDAAEVGIGVRALGVDPADPEGGGIVLEVCKNVIGGVDAQALAAGVVGDGGDDVGGGAGAADLDGEGRDEAAGAVALLGDALVGGGVGDDAAEGVVGPGGLKGLGVEQGVGGVVDVLRDSFQSEVLPVGGGGVVGGEAAGLLEEVFV
jgi:hypothetical protein